jgi:hypothetical protein
VSQVFDERQIKEHQREKITGTVNAECAHRSFLLINDIDESLLPILIFSMLVHFLQLICDDFRLNQFVDEERIQSRCSNVVLTFKFSSLSIS